MVDLHTHSNASDGIYSPTQLINLAYNYGIKCISLTDHDTVRGLKEAREESLNLGIEFINGIEFSADFKSYNKELHIIGLFFNIEEPNFKEFCNKMIEHRLNRNLLLLKSLNDMGIDIKKDELLSENPYFENIGRPNFARLLYKKGIAKNEFEAFKKYLSNDIIKDIKRVKFNDYEIINALHKAKGIAILAHPDQIGIKDHEEFLNFIKDLKDKGLDGIEVYYTGYKKKDVKYYKGIARKFDLVLSGGSDFHGTNRGVKVNLGKYGVNKLIPDKILDILKERVNTL